MRYSLLSPRRDVVRAFTLVELLVVIGIIAVLVGILLPVMSRARETANTTACMSNLRQIVQATLNYAADNKGSFPYGFVYTRSTATGGPARGDWRAWFTLTNQYMAKGATGDNEPDRLSPPVNPATTITLLAGRPMSGAFRCPSAAPTFRQQVAYYNNPVAMPHNPEEVYYNDPSLGPPINPANTSDCYPDNALFWDAPLLDSVGENRTVPMFGHSAFVAYQAASYIDGGVLTYPEYPQFRYRGYFTSSSSYRGDAPIWFPKDEVARANYGQPSFNADLGGNTSLNVGNARFRHSKDTICNAAMADGSVRSFVLNKKRDAFDPASYYSDFTSDHLRLKWPTGKKPSPAIGPND